MTTQALFEAAWPEASAQGWSASARLDVALSALRRRGLDAVLRSDARGYYLDPAVPVVMIE